MVPIVDTETTQRCNGAVPSALQKDNSLSDRLSIRLLSAEDTDLLTQHFCRLSTFDRYCRFFSATSAEGIRAIVDRFDWSRLCAAGAFYGGRIVGIGELGWENLKPVVAEVAFSVEETWRKKGLATRLINEVIKNGRQLGIKRIYATWLPGNDAVRRIITSQGGKCWHEGGLSRGAFFIEPLDGTQAKTGQLLRSI